MKTYYIAQSKENPWPQGGGKVFEAEQEAKDFIASKENMGCNSIKFVRSL